jgi:hypothetical protein
MFLGVLFGPIGFALAFTTGATCDHCGKKISAKAAVCPYCHTTFKVIAGTPIGPSNALRAQHEAGAHGGYFATKLCTFCAEEIRAEAIKCKHCGSMLS